MSESDRQPHDYDVDKRFAHIRVEVLGQEYTDVVRVCEQFPGLPDGITVYVEHVDAVDLKRKNGSGRSVEHLRCTVCGTNPSYALIGGEGFLVCHCTHVGGTMDPWPVHGFHGHPPEWEYRVEGETQSRREADR